MLLVDALPGHSVGFAIIILTLCVKIALFPLTKKGSNAQRKMKELEPEIKRLREQHKENKQKLAEHTMALYQRHGVTPFSGCLPMLVQIPIVIGLYWVFSRGLKVIDTSILYEFVQNPETLDMHFLVFDLAGKSLVLAVLAGISQYFQTDLTLGKQVVSEKKGENSSFQDDLAKSMQIQMRYVLPVMISFIAFSTSAAVALYWATSNILGIVQELIQRQNKGTAS